MTREEAEKFIDQTLWSGAGSDNAEKWVRIFETFGMLKLDEPKSGDEALQRLLNACGGVPYLATCVNETIAKAGLRLVLK